MVFPRIKSQRQEGNRFCTVYALVNALQIKTGGFISVWGAIIACFRYKMWPFLLNRSFNYEEAFAALNKYGVRVKMPDGEIKRIYPRRLPRIHFPEPYIGNEPVLAILGAGHAVVITADNGNYYETLDSQSRAGYVMKRKENLSEPFYLVLL